MIMAIRSKDNGHQDVSANRRRGGTYNLVKANLVVFFFLPVKCSAKKRRLIQTSAAAVVTRSVYC